MSSEEAAASLFGSDNSAADLFAGVGDDFSASTDSLFGSSTDYTQPPTLDAFSPQVENGPAHDPEPSYAPYAPHQQPAVPASNLYATPPPAPPLDNRPWNEAAPSTYPVSGLQQTPYAPPNATYAPPHAAYNPYELPQQPTSHYAPPPAAKPPAKQPYAYHNTTTTAAPYPSIASQPPPPPTATVTRPKVANAFDPPFLPSKTSRRTVGRSAGAQQAYTAYQSPISPPVHHASSPENIYQPTTHPSLLYSETKQTPQAGYSPVTPPPIGPGLTQVNSSRAPAQSASTPYSYPPPQGSLQANPGQNSHLQRINGIPPSTTSRNDIYGDARDTQQSPHTVGTAVEIAIENGHVAVEAETRTSSPSMVPLPYSPPQQKSDLGEASTPNSPESAVKVSPTLPPPRKNSAAIKDVYDQYTPKVNQNPANYIPRTSSPLHVGSAPEGRKPPAYPLSTLNGNATSNYHIHPRVSSNPGLARVTPVMGDSSQNYAQEILLKANTTQYAPSPSLVGANDPLSRTSARAPVVTFGFGGKMVTCFHGMPGLNTGFDVALSARASSELKIRVMKDIVPESALNMSSNYPGPLLSDPGTPSLSLVRPGVSSQNKTKKTGVLSYLSTRVDEITQGLGYLIPAARQAAEDKLVLVKLLQTLVENDGRLLGTPQAEASVRSILVPRLDSSVLQDGVALTAYQTTHPDEVPLAVTHLKPSSLSKIEEFLLQGHRRQAFQYALDEKLWAHAMVIASSIDKESWKEVVNEFLRTELAAKSDQFPTNTPHGAKQSWESLRVAYSIFSGQGAAAVQELAAPIVLQKTTGLLVPSIPSNAPLLTPRTPNFAIMQPAMNISPEALGKWPETVAMIMSSPISVETSAAITALGDQLLQNNWVEAAHACYLLSPQTSLIAGHGTPGARISLVGSKTPSKIDPDSIIFSEILEFALSLVPTVKGQEPFHGLPHLQAYRFIKSNWLAEAGDIQSANRYCEAIAASLSPGSPYTTPALVEQLQSLQQRLSGVFHGDKSGSWIASKLSKPSLDTIGGWLEGRFTKLVTGDSESSSPVQDQSKLSEHTFNGPFAHYSTISSTTPSARSSPQPQLHGPPQRTSSAMATGSPYAQAPIERSSSAMGYMRNQYGQASESSRDKNPYAPQSHSSADDLETPVQGSSWWGSDETNQKSQTPTAATFMHHDQPGASSNPEGFISLMDDRQYSFESTVSSRQPSTSGSNDINEDDDDLGLGNSKPKPIVENIEGEVASTTKETPAPKAAAPTPAAGMVAVTDTNGGSWFGRWWKRSDSTTPGPVKASLGDESAFYYDKELKRWVNKKAGAETAKPEAPPPPPSRAQTASPGMASSRPPPPPTSVTPPPPRSASAMDMTSEPPTMAPMRIRSNLAPPGTDPAPPTPGGRLTPIAGPPPGRPKSGASKRNIRSRYVDVFSQEGSATPPPS